MRLADENGKHRDRELDIEKDGMEGPDVEVARPLAENIRKEVESICTMTPDQFLDPHEHLFVPVQF
jgi:hypothetical protein